MAVLINSQQIMGTFSKSGFKGIVEPEKNKAVKKKPTTRKDFIMQIFCRNPETSFSCQQITNKIIRKQKLTGSVAHYLSGSITTILAGMVKKGVLKYAKEKTVRGGHLYEIDFSNVKTKK